MTRWLPSGSPSRPTSRWCRGAAGRSKTSPRRPSSRRSSGYPLVVKAASGGGGRGIRMVRDDDELAAALPSARAEAALAFGDPTVFLEKLVPAARHVEVQVIADGYGTVWAVGVRDCSLQRRHQKVLEESASTVLDATTGTGDPRRGRPIVRRGGLPQRGHRGVPGRPRHRQLPVHGGQHPAAGRAPGDRGDHRAGPGQAAAARRAGRPAHRHAAARCPGTRSRRG